MDNQLLKNIVEAALLASGRPLTLKDLRELFPYRQQPERDQIREAIKSLQENYENRGIELIEVATGFRIQVRPTMIDWLTKLWEERAPRYSRALLETLALVAYRQPITRGDIENVRGVAVSTNIMRTLLERGWVKVVGHRDVPGKPALYGTTPIFLEYFGLKKLDQLPPLAQISDIDSIVPQLELGALEEGQVTALRIVAANGETVGRGERPDDAVDADAAEPVTHEATAAGSAGTGASGADTGREDAPEPSAEAADGDTTAESTDDEQADVSDRLARS